MKGVEMGELKTERRVQTRDKRLREGCVIPRSARRGEFTQPSLSLFFSRLYMYAL